MRPNVSRWLPTTRAIPLFILRSLLLVTRRPREGERSERRQGESRRDHSLFTFQADGRSFSFFLARIGRRRRSRPIRNGSRRTLISIPPAGSKWKPSKRSLSFVLRSIDSKLTLLLSLYHDSNHTRDDFFRPSPYVLYYGVGEEASYPGSVQAWGLGRECSMHDMDGRVVARGSSAANLGEFSLPIPLAVDRFIY